MTESNTMTAKILWAIVGLLLAAASFWVIGQLAPSVYVHMGVWAAVGIIALLVVWKAAPAGATRTGLMGGATVGAVAIIAVTGLLSMPNELHPSHNSDPCQNCPASNWM